MTKRAFHGVHREKIPWFPTIDYDKCVGCVRCVEYCHFDVYCLQEKNGKNMPVVEKPNNCVVYCNGCDAICALGAIKHPSKLETGRLISKLRKK